MALGLWPLVGGGGRAPSPRSRQGLAFSQCSGCQESLWGSASHHSDYKAQGRHLPSFPEPWLAGGQSVGELWGSRLGLACLGLQLRDGACCLSGSHMPEGLWSGPLPSRAEASAGESKSP